MPRKSGLSIWWWEIDSYVQLMASVSYGEEKDAFYNVFEKCLTHVDIDLEKF